MNKYFKKCQISCLGVWKIVRPDDPVGVSAAHQAGQNFYHHHQTGQDPPKITQRAKNADADEN